MTIGRNLNKQRRTRCRDLGRRGHGLGGSSTPCAVSSRGEVAAGEWAGRLGSSSTPCAVSWREMSRLCVVLVGRLAESLLRRLWRAEGCRYMSGRARPGLTGTERMLRRCARSARMGCRHVISRSIPLMDAQMSYEISRFKPRHIGGYGVRATKQSLSGCAGMRAGRGGIATSCLQGPCAAPLFSTCRVWSAI